MPYSKPYPNSKQVDVQYSLGDSTIYATFDYYRISPLYDWIENEISHIFISRCSPHEHGDLVDMTEDDLMSIWLKSGDKFTRLTDKLREQAEEQL